MTLSDAAGRALIAEALRVYHRYATEVVERHNICPWAQHARATGHVRTRVLLQTATADLAPAMSELAALEADSECEVALLIFPLLDLDRLPFEHFAGSIRDADAARRELGTAPFAFAAFHPDAHPRLEDGERLIPFLRRTPDPTIQLVRRSILDAVHAKAPSGTEFVDVAHLLAGFAEPPQARMSLRARIAEDNKRTVQEVGLDAMEQLFADIRADRNRAYGRILEG